MQTIEGIFDGKSFYPTESVPFSKRHRVIITFLEEIGEEEEALRLRSADIRDFEFWNEPAEDIYQDYLTGRNADR